MNEQFKEQITAKAREFATAYTNRHFPNEPAFAFGNEGWAKFVDAMVELASAHSDKGTSALVEKAYRCVGCKHVYFESDVSCDCAVPALHQFTPCHIVDGPLPTGQVVPASGALERAHELGFLRCAGWAQRDDLFSDVTSQAYRKDRSHDLATITTPPQAATGVNPELLRGWQRYEKARKLNPRQWAELHRRNIAGEHFDDMIDALPDAETPLPQAAPVAQLSGPPEGWGYVLVNSKFNELMEALERADDKGYLPWAMQDEWDAFDWRIAAAPTTPKDAK